MSDQARLSGADASIAERVDAILRDCLYRDNEINGAPPPDAVLVEGIVGKYGFHPGRLSAHRTEIADLLRLMPDEFMADGPSGGMSFLNLCVDKSGEQWGEHRNMEQLVVLAIATDQGKFLLPRETWEVLPGGMPYVAFRPQSSPGSDFSK